MKKSIFVLKNKYDTKMVRRETNQGGFNVISLK